ncbi:unnamed protein product [Acanthoscelides obtectus]|uniref:Uncharacterized protein n=1 Tax=Acanthoscelides obtectus TaxID=200917 RepID=A0A9P0Q6N9_ACAOB|nr:unnamed protein product [Acanthoscelides obtectus]CAK1639539.1 hypothetical protein AOBTE_LOCUS11231 [Acanthoscelides obtectus]
MDVSICLLFVLFDNS